MHKEHEASEVLKPKRTTGLDILSTLQFLNYYEIELTQVLKPEHVNGYKKLN